MFEELGLNVARQADNGANPRPDNRTGWLDGETPDLVEDLLEGAEGQVEHPTAGRDGIEIRLWDPSTQLRFKAKGVVPPRPDGARNAVPVGWGD